MTEFIDRRLERLRYASTFLASHPEFHFDLQEHLLALEYLPYLANRFSSFAKLLELGSDRYDGSAILDELRTGRLRTVPAYTDLALTQRFADLPHFDRELLTSAFANYIPNTQTPASGRYMRTSGTSGRPLSIPYDLDFYFDYLFLTAKKVARASALQLDTPSPVFCVAIDNSRNDREFVVSDPLDGGLTICIIIDEATPATCVRLFELVDSLTPTIITTRPSIIEALIGYATASGSAFAHSPARVLAAGSFLSENLRLDAQRLFGAPITTSYGLSESGLVGFECIAHSGYHIDATSVFVEVLDEQDRRVPDGHEAEIVVSSVANGALPLIRYRTGDYGSFHVDLCDCGSSVPRLDYVKGRQAFHYRFSTGAILHPARLDPIFWLFPLSWGQVVQTSPDALEVEISIRDDHWADSNEIADNVRRFVAALVPRIVSIVVRKSSGEPVSKDQRYLTRLKA
jgi:phenylacetate-CoA ligase